LTKVERSETLYELKSLGDSGYEILVMQTASSKLIKVFHEIAHNKVCPARPRILSILTKLGK